MFIFSIIHYINNNKFKFNTREANRAYMPLLTYYKLKKTKKKITQQLTNIFIYLTIMTAHKI